MRAYSFRDTIALVNGVDVSGYADANDAIKAERNADAGTLSVGADGKGVLNVSADLSGKVTFKLQRTSGLNRYLQGLLLTMQVGTSSFVPVQLLLRNPHRGDTTVGVNGYIKKFPADQHGKEAQDREWVLEFEQLHFDFGNPLGAGTPSSIAEALG